MLVIFLIISILANKTPETASSATAAAPQLLSKLFPQTAVTDQEELKAEQEKQRQQEEAGWIFN